MGRELLIGCGRARDKRLRPPGRPVKWGALTTLDHNPDHAPDVVHDLEVLPYPFPDNSFDELHAYETLEHTGAQGDWRFFFGQFSEFWRILKPGGFLAATCPSYRSMWAWGDPSHRRVITSGSLVFLSQARYRSQIDGNPGPKTPMSDFRFCYSADFEPARDRASDRQLVFEDEWQLWFILQAVKHGA